MYTIEEFDQEKTKVMNYILYKKRTEYEVKNKFKNTIQNELLCDIISYVKEAGYLDDSNYIERAVNEFRALKNLSIREVKFKLYSKGINGERFEEYYDKYREELEEYERISAQNIVEKKKNSMQEEEITNYLRKKGYQEEIIKEVIKECKTY